MVFPRLLPQPGVGHIVQFVECQIDAGLNRAFPEQTGTKRVDRANKTPLDGVHRRSQTTPGLALG